MGAGQGIGGTGLSLKRKVENVYLARALPRLSFSSTQATCSLPDAPRVHSGLTWRNNAHTKPPKAKWLQELWVLEEADLGGDWKCGFDPFGGKQKPSSFMYWTQDCPYLEEVIYVLLKMINIKRIRTHG